jgi:cation diffusion facilitator CzcD-associated flavoprotein CzcO
MSGEDVVDVVDVIVIGAGFSGSSAYSLRCDDIAATGYTGFKLR